VYSRYVAIGDSSTEGLVDPHPLGGYRGWTDRLAERLATANPGLEYANLGVRGRLSGQILEEQVPAAIALRADLVTVTAGLNDVLRLRRDLAAVARTLDEIYTRLAATGATVATFTLPDLSSLTPVARLARRRLLAFNDALREISARTGVVLVELADEPIVRDPRFWSEDRLHGNSAGHERVGAAMAEAIGAPGADGAWREVLPFVPAAPRSRRALAELIWLRRHMGPWVWRRVRGTSSGDGLSAKRPAPRPVSDV